MTYQGRQNPGFFRQIKTSDAAVEATSQEPERSVRKCRHRTRQRKAPSSHQGTTASGMACNSADKPGSVEAHRLSGEPGQSCLWDLRCRDPLAAYLGAARATPLLPYLALPRMGFAVP